MAEFHLGRWASERIPEQRHPTLFTLFAMFIVAIAWASEAGVVAPKELGIAVALAVQVALLLLLASLLHAWRPRGPDIPSRTWIDSSHRCRSRWSAWSGPAAAPSCG